MKERTDFERHAAAYRRLLGLYPPSFRRDFGEDAARIFLDLCRREAGSGGAGLARLWLATVPRLVWGGLLERLAEALPGGAPAAWAPRRPPGAGAPEPTPAAVRPATDDPTRPPYLWAFLAGLSVFLLYVVTLAPTTAFWDTSEYIATAHILGVPHPPGNPLFVVLARAWEVLLTPLGLPTAVTINLLSAFMSASAHGLWFLVVHRVLASSGSALRGVGAGAAVLVSATAFTVWNQSNVNEKVYTVSLMTIALLSFLALRWRDARGSGAGDRLLVLIAFVLALSVGNHLMAFLAAPALAVFVLVVRPRVLLDPRLYPALLLAGAAGLSVHLYLPIRAALDPVINQGAPLCASIADAMGSILTYGRRGCEALSDALTRRQYRIEGEPGPGLTGPRQAPLTSQLVNYLQYFDWQWARSVQGTRALLADLRVPFTMLFTGLGVWGALEHARRDRASFAYQVVLFATVSMGLVYYLNFEYGFAIPDPVGDFEVHEVRERDYFFVVSFSLWGLWAGMGIATLWSRLRERLRGSLALASPVLLLAAVPLALNWSWADRSHDWAARDWAFNLLQSVEPYGVLFTVGDNDTFPLWYLQEVEGVRRDVTVVVTTYLNTPWYVKQLRALSSPCPPEAQAGADPTRIVCQREYAPGPEVAYTDRPEALSPGVVPLVMESGPQRPELPVLQLDDATIDRIAGVVAPLPEARAVQLGPIRPVLPGGQYVYPWHQFALAIVDTAFADGRPVYWAANGNDARSLGLDPWLVRQGLAFKVVDRPPPHLAGDGVVEFPGDAPYLGVTGRWVDLPRTRTLLDEVFVHRGGLPHWEHWPDRPSASVPMSYGVSYYALAVAYGLRGDGEAAARYQALAGDWLALTD